MNRSKDPTKRTPAPTSTINKEHETDEISRIKRHELYDEIHKAKSVIDEGNTCWLIRQRSPHKTGKTRLVLERDENQTHQVLLELTSDSYHFLELDESPSIIFREARFSTDDC